MSQTNGKTRRGFLVFRLVGIFAYVTFEEAKTEHTFEVLKCLGPTKCPLRQKCTRPSSGTPNVTVAIGFLLFPARFRTFCWTDLHTPLFGDPNVTVAIGFLLFPARFRTPRWTDLHTPLFGDPKWHRSNRFFIYFGPRYTDLHTSVRSMDWLEATQSITNLKGHRNSSPPSQFRVLTCWVHLVLRLVSEL